LVFNPYPDAATVLSEPQPPITSGIPPASPLQRLKQLQRFGRPVEIFRPLLSTLSAQHRDSVNEALAHAHAICSLSPEVVMMLMHEARFMSATDIAGQSLHTSICGAPLCSLSVFIKQDAPQLNARHHLPRSSDRPQLLLHLDESLSVMLRHHVLHQHARDEALKRTIGSSGIAAIKSPGAAFEIKGLKEARAFLSDALFKNAVFALLKGENVIIQGRDEDRNIIMGIVRALSLFIPQNVFYRGSRAGSISPSLYQEWRDDPLDISDLANVKLAGAPLALDIHDRAKAFISKITISHKSITSNLPKYRSDDRFGLLHTIVGKSSLVEKWSNEVLAAHVRMEMCNLGRNIMHWIFVFVVPRARSLLSSKTVSLPSKSRGPAVALLRDLDALCPVIKQEVAADSKSEKSVSLMSLCRCAFNRMWSFAMFFYFSLFCFLFMQLNQMRLKSSATLSRPSMATSMSLRHSSPMLSAPTVADPLNLDLQKMSEDDSDLVQVLIRRLLGSLLFNLIILRSGLQ
jgi:hypothetical protein